MTATMFETDTLQGLDFEVPCDSPLHDEGEYHDPAASAYALLRFKGACGCVVDAFRCERNTKRSLDKSGVGLFRCHACGARCITAEVTLIRLLKP